MRKTPNFLVVVCIMLLTACSSSPSKIPMNEIVEVSEIDEQELVDSGLANEKKYKIICKSFAPTGTRIGKKECRTEKAWNELRRIAKNRLDNETKPQSNNPNGLPKIDE